HGKVGGQVLPGRKALPAIRGVLPADESASHKSIGHVAKKCSRRGVSCKRSGLLFAQNSHRDIDYVRFVGIFAAVFRGRGRFLFQVYTDRSITCADCGQEFTFTAGEQEFYAQRGFTESPKRCATCRQIRKAQRNRGSSDGARGDGYGNQYGDSGG